MTDYSTIYSNNLEEVQMIAGGEQIFYYNIYNKEGTPLDIEHCETSVVIFKYGDPTYVMTAITGCFVDTNPDKNQFYVTFSGSGLSGVYQQQVTIVDTHGHIHIPCQGKIIIFPSNMDAISA